MSSYFREVLFTRHSYKQIHKACQYVPMNEIHSSSKTNIPDDITIKYDTINLPSTHDQTFQKSPFFPGHENCHQCKAYIPADRIITRVRITEQADKSVEIKHEENVELWEPASKTDAEKAEEKACMVVEVRKFGSLVSVIMNEEYVRVSGAHEDAGCSANYGPVKKTELWKVSGTTT
ncbi:hypothetical protein BHYA_0034g00550 [Botrytis hyacinthi]|uniref:Uncharacterized protein n=1 Tax=Botrytis hyacinthi TaxID=278943 RepID=A0A4Z1GV69_9HELO|nr:hypothetical protein BHYA_0034g00550 [Botrytis hyacinthi]